MNLERFKVWTILPREPLKLLMFLAGTVTLCCIAFAAYQGAMWMREGRHETTARWKQVESATGLLETHMPGWVASIDRTLGNLESTSRNTDEATANVKKRTPEIISSFTGVGKEGTALIADVRRDTLPILNGAADGAKRMIDNSEPNFTKATASIRTAAASLAHSMEQIDARISDPKTARWIDEQMDLGHKVLLKVDEIAGKTVVMSSNGEQMTAKGVEVMGHLSLITKDTSDFVHGYLTARPRWYTKWILTPVKAALGYGLTVYQITR